MSRIYFQELRELREEARRQHVHAIQGNADFAEAIRIWCSVQLAIAQLYVAWYLPRSTGWGKGRGARAAHRLDAALA